MGTIDRSDLSRLWPPTRFFSIQSVLHVLTNNPSAVLVSFQLPYGPSLNKKHESYPHAYFSLLKCLGGVPLTWQELSLHLSPNLHPSCTPDPVRKEATMVPP